MAAAKVPLNAWLARHGQSTANVGLPAPDADSIALTELGQAQAQALAESLPHAPDLLVISPLRRAIQTAAPILARWPHLVPETWPIQEINYLSTQRCANTTPLERRPWVDEYWQRNDPHYQDGADAESFAQFWQRVYQFHQRIAAYDSGQILVVGHGQFFHACLMLQPDMTAATPAIMQAFHRTERDNPLANGTRVAMPLPFSARTSG